jgi:3-oxoacyl-[acyl-carrier-protein] synthase-3
VCNSFATQMTVATSMIGSGRFRYGLLTQSSGLARLSTPDDPMSVLLGDGATAQVVGPVSPGRGVLGYAHRTDGELAKALVLTVPGKYWYEDGRVVALPLDPDHARKMLFGVAERGREVVHEALAGCGLTTADVAFYASHQATRWFRPATQKHIGLEHARTVDTFPWAGSVSAANLPLVLSTAEREGLLRDGDLVVTFSGGTGMTWSSVVMRWGR